MTLPSSAFFAFRRSRWFAWLILLVLLCGNTAALQAESDTVPPALITDPALMEELFDSPFLPWFRSRQETSDVYFFFNHRPDGEEDYITYVGHLDAASEAISWVLPLPKFLRNELLHEADNRLYFAYEDGTIGILDLSTLDLTEWAFDAPTGWTEAESSHRTIVACGPGRLLLSAPWEGSSLYDTATGEVLAVLPERLERGAFDSNSSILYAFSRGKIFYGNLHKFDLSTDQFVALHEPVSTRTRILGPDDRALFLSPDGTRLCSETYIFQTSDLALLTNSGIQSPFAFSSDSVWLFGSHEVERIEDPKETYVLDDSGTSVAFNWATAKVINGSPGPIRFFDFAEPEELGAPALEFASNPYGYLILRWPNRSIRTLFSLQYRAGSDDEWTDLKSHFSHLYEAEFLWEFVAERGIHHEFRLRAEAGDLVSPWSETVSYYLLTQSEEWREEHFGSPENEGAGADSFVDSYGVSNLEHLAFDLPFDAPPQFVDFENEIAGLPLMRSMPETRLWQIEFMRRSAPTNWELEYRVETSTDFLNWIPVKVPRPTSIPVQKHGWNGVRYTVAFPSDADAEQWVRVRVVRLD
jgi:hypothetical protein